MRLIPGFIPTWGGMGEFKLLRWNHMLRAGDVTRPGGGYPPMWGVLGSRLSYIMGNKHC